QMSFGIEHSIPDDPDNEKADRNHAQRMAVKKRVTVSGHEDVSAFCYLSLVNHHGAGLAISQSTSFHCSPVRTRLSFHEHISSIAKQRSTIQTAKWIPGPELEKLISFSTAKRPAMTRSGMQLRRQP